MERKTTLQLLDQIEEEYLKELCEKEEIEDFVREYRADIDDIEPEEDRLVMRGYPVWIAGVSNEWDIMYQLLKKGYGFHGRIEEGILDIANRFGESTGYADYDIFKTVFLGLIFETKFLEHYFIEKKDEDTERVCKELEDYIKYEPYHREDFYEKLMPLYLEAEEKGEKLVYADYMPWLMQELKTYISEEKKKKEQQ